MMGACPAFRGFPRTRNLFALLTRSSMTSIPWRSLLKRDIYDGATRYQRSCFEGSIAVISLRVGRAGGCVCMHVAAASALLLFARSAPAIRVDKGTETTEGCP